MAKKLKEGDVVAIATTVVSINEDGSVTLEINDGLEDNHHNITLSADQLSESLATVEK